MTTFVLYFTGGNSDLQLILKLVILVFGHWNILIKKIPEKGLVTTVKQSLIAVKEIHCTKDDVSRKVFFSKFEKIRIFCGFVQIYYRNP